MADRVLLAGYPQIGVEIKISQDWSTDALMNMHGLASACLCDEFGLDVRLLRLPFCWHHFKAYVLRENCIWFQFHSFHSNNGLASNRRQAIISINNGLVYWNTYMCHSASISWSGTSWQIIIMLLNSTNRMYVNLHIMDEHHSQGLL